jgi:CBS domain-containing protein
MKPDKDEGGCMDIRDVMTTRPRAVTPDSTLSQVAELMEAEDVGVIPIVDGDFLVGMVTDRDIVVRAVARGFDPSQTRVSQVASDDLVTVRPSNDLSDALDLMARHQVRRLPVTDDENRLVGVVSQADVARHAKEKAAGEMLEDISQPPRGPRTVGPGGEGQRASDADATPAATAGSGGPDGGNEPRGSRTA